MTDSRVVMVASPDDYLLEEARRAALESMVALLDGAEVEEVPEGAPAEDVALLVQSPSLFAERRVLTVSDAGRWLGGGRRGTKTAPAEDPTPLVEVLETGLPEETALILAAGSKGPPKGDLASAVEQAGTLDWIPLPEPPKPWEDAGLSADQAQVLRGVLHRAAPEAAFEPEAERLLMERLGFAPRQLAQEARKLASAAGEKTVTTDLVMRLVLPAGRGLEEINRALEECDFRAILRLLARAEQGMIVRDWRGKTLDVEGLAGAIAGLVRATLEKMLYLRRLAVSQGMAEELEPKRNSARDWYKRRFKPALASRLQELIADDSGSPFVRRDGRRTAPSPWSLHLLFRAAGRIPEALMIRALAEAGPVERACRGSAGPEAVTSWLLTLDAGLVKC